MKKRVQLQNIKPTQILTKSQTNKLKGGDGEGDTESSTEDIIVEDTLIL